MKFIIFFNSILFFFICCSANRNILRIEDKLEIIRIDTTSDFYVFTARDSSRKSQIILAERERVKKCYPFKKFIIKDSIKTTYELKAGSTYTFIGATGFSIDGIKVKESGELAKIIWNCGSFID